MFLRRGRAARPAFLSRLRRPPLPGWARRTAGRGRDRLDEVLGGRARRQVVLVLTSVLALAVADQGVLSATASGIQASFGVSKAAFGLLGSVTTAVSAVATLPFGVYVDRSTRTRLLAGSIVLWTAAMVAGGAATGYVFLLGTRVFLGIVVAVSYPAIASLIGDYFPSGERGRVYGYVLSGELLGTGAGLVLASAATSIFGTWRAALLVLAVPAVAVAWLVHRLPEPARGGASRMPRGQQEILSAERVREGAAPDPVDEDAPEEESSDLAHEAVERSDAEPHEEPMTRRDPATLSLPAAVVQVLRVRTNALVIVASALGYFFFAGLRLFGLQLITDHYGVGHGVATLMVLLIGVAAVGGVVSGGRVTDRLLRNGRANARVVVPAVTFVVTAVFLGPGLVASSLGVALALILPGAFVFAASNPPLDAARLDVMPHALWGRAESVRSVCRGALEAAAPVTVGFLAGAVFGGGGHGLMLAFLVLLGPLLFSGAVLVLAARTYPSDVATAMVSERTASEDSEAHPA